MASRMTSSTRREFLHQTLGTITVLSMSSASAETGSSTWVLAADPHINGDPDIRGRGVNMTEHLQLAVDQILVRARGAEAVLLNGDCAHVDGREGDYRQLGSLLQPLRTAGLDVLMTLGNHDDRHWFRHVFAASMPQAVPTTDKLLTVVTTPLVNWFLLDTLDVVNEVTGELGPAQLAWLESVLDQFPGHPAVVVGHHNPQFEPLPGPTGKPRFTGLTDSGALFDLLHAKPHVQAYAYGHTHDWKVTQSARGLPLINLPPIAYTFDPSRPSGWVKTTVTRDGMILELRSLDPDHPEHGQRVNLPWRS